MELLEYWKILRKRLWLIVLLMLVAGASAAFYSLRQVPLYSSTTTLFLNPGVTGSALLPPTQQIQQLANTFSEFMRTQSFATLVAREMNAAVPERDILQGLTTQWVQNTQFFRIAATLPDPRQAQALADAAAQVLISENIARQQAQRRQLEAQTDPARESERLQLSQLQKTLDDQVAGYRDHMTGLQTQIAELEGKPRTEDNDKRILALREELIKTQQLWVELLSSQSRVQSSLTTTGQASTTGDTAVVVDKAPLPAEPMAMRTLQNILFALAAALVLGGGLAFMLEYLRFSIRTPEELEQVYGMSTLGVIGTVGSDDDHGPIEQPIVAASRPSSPSSEAFRALRTNIQFANLNGPLHSLMVTSAGPGEGKSFIASNLAISLAQAGQRVLLVDADLRRPSLHKVFKLHRMPGLSNLIVHLTANPAEFLQPTEIENLWLLPAGVQPPNPAEVLGSVRAAEVIEELKLLADIVIYDSPPSATVTDGLVLASRVDAVIHVVLANATRPDLVASLKGALEKVGAHVIGPVLNQVHIGDLGYYGYYYQSDYYNDTEDQAAPSGLQRLFGKRPQSSPTGKVKVVHATPQGFGEG